MSSNTTSTTNLTQPPSDPPSNSGLATTIAKEIFAAMDTNSDGIITASEETFSSSLWSLINVNGQLTAAELISDIGAIQPQGSPGGNQSSPPELTSTSSLSDALASYLIQSGYLTPPSNQGSLPTPPSTSTSSTSTSTAGAPSWMFGGVGILSYQSAGLSQAGSGQDINLTITPQGTLFSQG